MAAERINMFHEDCQKLTTGEGINHKRIASEIQKLKRWMQKHQDESVPDSAKSKLLVVINKYKSMASNPELTDVVYSLVEDYLKLPEGKLLSSKDKQGCLRWLQSTAGGESDSTHDDSNVSATSTARYIVGDITDNNLLLLMSPDPNVGDVLEDVKVGDSVLERRIVEAFNSCDINCTIYVDINTSDLSVLSCSVEDVNNGSDSATSGIAAVAVGRRDGGEEES